MVEVALARFRSEQLRALTRMHLSHPDASETALLAPCLDEQGRQLLPAPWSRTGTEGRVAMDPLLRGVPILPSTVMARQHEERWWLLQRHLETTLGSLKRWKD